MEGLTVEPVESAEEIENLMEEGNKSSKTLSFMFINPDIYLLL